MNVLQAIHGTMTSERQRKKAIQRGVAKLKAKPGWDPAKRERESPEEALEELARETGSQRAYAAAVACEACAVRQNEFGDPSALCEVHLAEAMGL